MELGKFEILEELGRGGFGIVYKALDKILDRLVAIKVLQPNLVNDPTFISRFLLEARTASNLDHPNLVPIYEFGEIEGRYYIVMSYMPGGSLKELLQKEGSLSQGRAVEIIQQIAEGLTYVHNQGVIHRDLKPGNVLFDAEGVARVSDMGFAKLIRSDNSTSMSTSGDLVGTPAYMAPEIWNGQPATSATDVYSLACILVEMLTSEPLFGGETTPMVMKKHFERLQLPRNFPEDWKEIIKASLEKDPRKRISTVEQLVSGLKSTIKDRRISQVTKKNTPIFFGIGVTVALVVFLSIRLNLFSAQPSSTAVPESVRTRVTATKLPEPTPSIKLTQTVLIEHANPKTDLGNIRVGLIETSANVVSLEDSVELSAVIEGNNIGYIYFFTGLLDETSNSIYVIDTDYLESSQTGQESGVYYPIWPDAEQFRLNFEFEPILYTITDGSQEVLALFNPQSYGRNASDAVYFVDGTYTFQGTGESRTAQLLFRDGKMFKVLTYTGSSTTGAPYETTPNVGDTFTVSRRWMDLDTNGSVTAISFDAGDTITFSGKTIEWGTQYLPDGTYLVGFLVADMDGNITPAYTQITVR